MFTHNFKGTVVVKNSESGAIAKAILTDKTADKLKVQLNGVPLILERVTKDRYTATCSSLSLYRVSG